MIESMPIDTIDILVIFGYLLGVIGIGYYASRKVKTSADYAVAGRQFNLPILSGTLIGSTIGAAATMGKAGKTFEAGYAVLYASLAYLVGYLFLAILAPKLRAANIDSLPDVLQRRFGPGMRIMAAVILLIVVVPMVSIQLIACALIVTKFMPDLGLGYGEVIILAAIIIVLYTLLGGLLAVAYTDLAQVIIMMFGLGLLLPIFLALDLGSMSAIKAALEPPTAGWLGGLSPGYVISFFPIFTAFVVIDAGSWQRIAAAKNAEDLRPAMLITAGFYGFWSILVVGLGVVAFNTYPDLASPDSAIPQMVMDYMPPVFKGICLAAIIALIMSTADSLLLIAGTTVSWDCIRVIRPETADKKLLRIGRVTIMVAGVLSVLFALSKIPLFDINALSLAVFVSGLFVPIMAALFYKKATSAGAVAASITGIVVVLGLYGMQLGFGINMPLQPIIIGLSLSAAMFVLVSQLTYKNARITAPVLTPVK